MLLNLLNLFSLIIALFKKIYKMNERLDELRQCHGDQLLTTTNPSTFFSTSPTDSNGIVEATTIFSIIHAATSDLFPTIIPKLTTMATTTLNENVKNVSQCTRIFLVNCSKISNITTKSVLTTILALNFTSTILPEIRYQSTGGSTVSSYTDYDFTTDIFPSADFNFTTNMYDNRSSSDYFDNVTDAPDVNGGYPIDTTTRFPYDSIITMKSDYDTTEDFDQYDYLGTLGVGRRGVVDLLFYVSSSYTLNWPKNELNCVFC